MTITITSTGDYVTFDGIDLSRWEGVTEGGARCEVFVRRIRLLPGEDATEFDRDLTPIAPPPELGGPSGMTVAGMILFGQDEEDEDEDAKSDEDIWP